MVRKVSHSPHPVEVNKLRVVVRLMAVRGSIRAVGDEPCAETKFVGCNSTPNPHSESESS